MGGMASTKCCMAIATESRVIVATKQRDLFTRQWRSIIKPQKESALQIVLVAMLRLMLKPTVIWRHVPNGEHRDIRTASKLKAMGVLPGSADLEFHWVEVDALQRKRRRCLHLELKVDNRPQTDSQVAFELAVRTMLGDEYAIARSVDEAIAILDELDLFKDNVTVKQWRREGG